MSNHGNLEDLMKEIDARVSAFEALTTSPAPDRTGAPSRAVIYCRPSETSDYTAALGRQLQTCRDIATHHDVEVVEEVHDRGPGLLGADRPGWDRAMQLLTSSEADVLICADWSRISRRVVDYQVVVATAKRLRFTIIAGNEICAPDGAHGRTRGRR